MSVSDEPVQESTPVRQARLLGGGYFMSRQTIQWLIDNPDAVHPALMSVLDEEPGTYFEIGDPPETDASDPRAQA
jgi:hypothetical protein